MTHRKNRDTNMVHSLPFLTSLLGLVDSTKRGFPVILAGSNWLSGGEILTGNPVVRNDDDPEGPVRFDFVTGYSEEMTVEELHSILSQHTSINSKRDVLFLKQPKDGLWEPTRYEPVGMHIWDVPTERVVIAVKLLQGPFATMVSDHLKGQQTSRA